MTTAKAHVCSTPEADIRRAYSHVRFVPEADIAPPFGPTSEQGNSEVRTGNSEEGQGIFAALGDVCSTPESGHGSERGCRRDRGLFKSYETSAHLVPLLELESSYASVAQHRCLGKTRRHRNRVSTQEV